MYFWQVKFFCFFFRVATQVKFGFIALLRILLQYSLRKVINLLQIFEAVGEKNFLEKVQCVQVYLTHYVVTPMTLEGHIRSEMTIKPRDKHLCSSTDFFPLVKLNQSSMKIFELRISFSS